MKTDLLRRVARTELILKFRPNRYNRNNRSRHFGEWLTAWPRAAQNTRHSN